MLGERACPRVVDPLVEGGSAGDDLLELPAVPGLRGVADIVQVPKARELVGIVYNRRERQQCSRIAAGVKLPRGTGNGGRSEISGGQKAENGGHGWRAGLECM